MESATSEASNFLKGNRMTLRIAYLVASVIFIWYKWNMVAGGHPGYYFYCESNLFCNAAVILSRCGLCTFMAFSLCGNSMEWKNGKFFGIGKGKGSTDFSAEFCRPLQTRARVLHWDVKLDELVDNIRGWLTSSKLKSQTMARPESKCVNFCDIHESVERKIEMKLFLDPGCSQGSPESLKSL